MTNPHATYRTEYDNGITCRATTALAKLETLTSLLGSLKHRPALLEAAAAEIHASIVEGIGEAYKDAAKEITSELIRAETTPEKIKEGANPTKPPQRPLSTGHIRP